MYSRILQSLQRGRDPKVAAKRTHATAEKCIAVMHTAIEEAHIATDVDTQGGNSYHDLDASCEYVMLPQPLLQIKCTRRARHGDRVRQGQASRKNSRTM